MSLRVDMEKKLGSFRLQMQFEAENGVLALLGASGSGKSMTLKCIAGIERPDRGRIELDGRVLFDSAARIDLPPQKRRVGYLFQQYALFPHMTVQENIACGIRASRGSSSAARQQIVQEIVDRLGLTGLEKKRPWQLSGGEQQRTALARILVNEPEVLLLDEPFSALDSHLRFRMEQEVREIIAQFGKPVLLVSHNRDEVFRLADHVALLKDGVIETAGEKHAVFANPRTVNGARLTGCKNISPVRVLDGQHVLATDWGLTLRVAGSADGTDGADSGSGPVTHVGIRMHDVSPQKPQQQQQGALAGAAPENLFRLQVAEEVENPFSVTVMLRSPEQSGGGQPAIGMELPKEVWAACRGEEVWVSLPPERILLLRG